MDRPAGRKRVLTATPVAQWAERRGLTVFKCADVNTPAFVEQAAALRADAAVVIAFGQKRSEPFIAALGELAVNLHASLLPRWRGASPIHSAMLAGDYETGLSVIGLAQRMDAGLVYAQEKTVIEPTETVGELHDRLAALGGGVVQRVLDDLQRGTLTGAAQDESLVTKAPKLSKADGTVDFDDTCYRVRCRINGLTPWPGVTVTWRDATGVERPLMLRRAKDELDLSCFIGVQRKREPRPGAVLEGYRVACADGAVRLLEVQSPGGAVMAVEAFARGRGLRAGDVMTARRAEGEEAKPQA